MSNPVAELQITALLDNANGACSLANGTLQCAAASLSPGGSIARRVRVVPAAPVLYDLEVPFAFEVTTTSDSVARH